MTESVCNTLVVRKAFFASLCTSFLSGPISGSHMALQSLSALPLIQMISTTGQGALKRYALDAPIDNGTFILPMKQCFMKDARLMPGTRVMLALLSGWGGAGGPIETTQGIIGKHLSRSISQIRRYIHDAARLGYLRYSYTKNRLGMITGIKVMLSFSLLRANKKPVRPKKPALPQRVNTNRKHIYNNKIEHQDAELQKRLNRLQSLIDH